MSSHHQILQQQTHNDTYLFDSSFFQKGTSFCKRQSQCGSKILEILKGMLLPNMLQLGLAPFVDAIKDIQKQVRKDIHNLVVVLFDGHFHIESCKFTQVSWRIGILGSKDGTSRKDSLKSRTRCCHLFVELWTHGQTRFFCYLATRPNKAERKRHKSQKL